jgi:adenine deaminase
MATKKSVSILVDVAMGRKPANLVIRNGTWVCVQSGEFIPKTDIAIIDGTIAYVGADASHTIGRKTNQIDAGGSTLYPACWMDTCMLNPI